ncbi:hypothetical protein CERZMDRAFT_103803 [Cercospora zeae-maydis SCOH1-5]|uniref:Uncharacterized protein n=1 Tax=Cercospora zeae-maydis SCOH1-5 TaxID=717836 RepID=A0A6A6EYY3_9PEZI|nr:hypothetical protein CERZMDRAFT_103803 [Cercospora zeae-maydis SCOH1-5]
MNQLVTEEDQEEMHHQLLEQKAYHHLEIYDLVLLQEIYHLELLQVLLEELLQVPLEELLQVLLV